MSCLTVYMANLMYGKDAPQGSFMERCEFVFAEIDKLLLAARNSGKLVVLLQMRWAEVSCLPIK